MVDSLEHGRQRQPAQAGVPMHPKHQRLHRAGRRMTTIGFVCLLFGLGSSGAAAQCPGDNDGDGAYSAHDIELDITVMFAASFIPAEVRGTADATQDGKVTAADLVQLTSALGRTCSQPTPTRTPTPSALPLTPTPTPTPTPSVTSTATPTAAEATATSTATRSPSATATPSASPNPTIACEPIVIGSSFFDGSLTSGDCVRLISGQQRLSDAYLFHVDAAHGVTINVSNVGSTQLQPYIVLSDPSGVFPPQRVNPPLQFTSKLAQTYSLVVTADPKSPDSVGDYRIEIASRSCPSPTTLGIPGFRSTTIADDECVDPQQPAVGTRSQGADAYAFNVTTPPVNVSLTMRQVSSDEFISPELRLYSPAGVLLVDDIDTIDCANIDDDRECVQLRFLALKTGTYSAFAGGGGDSGRYTLTLASPSCRATALAALPTAGVLPCADQTTPPCKGTWSGDTRKTPCAAPLLDPDDDDPENGAPSDLYTFTAQAGQTVHVRLATGGDPYVYLLGPTSAGNPLLGFDSAVTTVDAKLTIVLPTTGTYTIVAANGTLLDPPDDDAGESLDYTLFVESVSP